MKQPKHIRAVEREYVQIATSICTHCCLITLQLFASYIFTNKQPLATLDLLINKWSYVLSNKVISKSNAIIESFLFNAPVPYEEFI